jgi:hypothetical protein
MVCWVVDGVLFVGSLLNFGMTQKPLSPTTQAVLDAFTEDDGFLHDWRHNHYNIDALAAALRTVMDLVVPEHREHYPNTLDERYRNVSVFNVRNEILSIINELENGE